MLLPLTFDTATKILVLGGLLSLVASFAIGFVLSRYRLRPPNVAPAYVHLAHKNALWEGFMMLGLVWAVQLSSLPDGVETVAAVLIVAAAGLQVLSSVVAWLSGTQDEFAQRSLSFYLATINALLVTPGVLILLGGVVAAIFFPGPREIYYS
ncbi:MAG: hypothetical protein QOE92_1870 [Chloroflexota bacterium]|nr:hypothetical protein [Chloroflexota bacterium]